MKKATIMTLWQTNLLHSALVACVALCAPQAAAQAYPTKPLRIVVGFSAGGATDATARMLAQSLGEILGQRVTVDNRTGAAGAIATERVATSPPDGYTLLMMTAADPVLPALRPKLPYNLERDFAPVSLVATAPFVLVIHPSVPAQNVRQLIALARSRAGKLNYGSFGAGSSAHLMAELFNLMGKVSTVHVPYKGAAESAIALVAGQIDMSFVAVSTAQPFIVAGRLRPLGVTSAKRASLMPAVPTLHESGLDGYDRSGWYGIVAPRGVSHEILMRLHAAIARVVSNPDVRRLFGTQGLEPQANQSDEFAAFIRAEIAQNARLIKTIGLKAE